jgi:hypothetical protein
MATLVTQGIVSVTADLTVTDAMSTVLGNGTFSIFLPAVAGRTGRTLTVKNIGAGVLTLDGNSTELIEAAQTLAVAAGDTVELECTGTKWVTVGGRGPQGAQGTTGSGAQGTQGFQGFQGFQGLTGTAGSQGASGGTGSQGSQGYQGHQGYQGTTGGAGGTGSQGPQGAAGSAGSTGAQGAQGAGINPTFCEVTLSSNLGVNSTSETLIYWDTETEDSANLHGAGQYYIQVNAAGLWRITAHLADYWNLDSGIGGCVKTLRLYKNAVLIATAVRAADGFVAYDTATTFEINREIACSANDYFYVTVYAPYWTGGGNCWQMRSGVYSWFSALKVS